MRNHVGAAAALVQSVIRLMVVDDHGLFVRGLELVLGAGSHDRIQVVASTSDPFEVERLVAEHDPDVVIVDLAMPTRSGEEVVAALKTASPSIRTLIVSGSSDLERVQAAVRNGADGFVPKTSNPAELLGPILSVAAGWSVLPRTVLDEFTGPVLPPVPIEARDLWLVRSLAAGSELKKLAAGLHVSERTAKRSIANLLDLLGVDSRIEAVALAGRMGLLEEPADPDRAPAA